MRLRFRICKFQMKKRDYVLIDDEFWRTLEFKLSRCLSASEDLRKRQYWCDGFIPETSVNTKNGVEVVGKVWMVNDKRDTMWDFLATFPQSLLYRTITRYQFKVLEFDPNQSRLVLEISKLKSE